MDQQVMRILAFRPVRVAYDDVLRKTVIPALWALPGIGDCYGGRQGPDDLGPRIVISVWRSESAMEDAERGMPPGSGVERLGEVVDAVLEVVPLLVARRFAVSREPRILRVTRGNVRPGELPSYADDVGAGVDADAERDAGPLSLYMGGVGGPDSDEFMTASTWHQWEDIEAATGGDVHRPTATRRPERLVAWDVRHFEIVPNC